MKTQKMELDTISNMSTYSSKGHDGFLSLFHPYYCFISVVLHLLLFIETCVLLLRFFPTLYQKQSNYQRRLFGDILEVMSHGVKGDY